MTCATCLASIPEAARFCPECGTALNTPTEASTVFTPMPSQSDQTRLPTPTEAFTVLPPTPGRPPSRAGRPGSSAGSGRLGATPAAGTDPRTASRFEPGTVLGGRFRIVGLLGRGGMGEVYRADDMTLGQPVALKFLPDVLVNDPEALARFRGEVRAAREVSHPHVVRVYDITEADGLTFLSMEFVQGEDLASLLRRIGRISPDRAAEMGRELCAGLSAAHAKGVLHRDLKPANVMIDEQGSVRLADFGLAGAEFAVAGGIAGTPAYMAPELFDRQPATVASDIYALGLVLFEIFTGRQVFSGNTAGELARQHREEAPTRIAKLVGEIDPQADRVIQKCLEKNPAARPRSALAVGAALPGGDPLAAALAAGETPSPEIVAAAGGVGALTPRVAAVVATALLAGLVVVVWLSARTQAVQYLPQSKPAAVLVDQAHSILQKLGYQEPFRDSAWGYTSTDYIQHLLSDTSPGRWDGLRYFQPPGVAFWYRQAPVPLSSDSFGQSGKIGASVPPVTVPGMAGVLLDLKGRLQFLAALPPRIHETAEQGRKADWAPLLEEAGFPLASLTETRPSWLPPVYVDTRVAWNTVYPDRPDIPVHIEAGATGGRATYFQVFEPWSQETLNTVQGSGGVAPLAVVAVITLTVVIGGAVFLGRRNLRLGRGDQAGAMRVAGTLGTLAIVAGFLAAHQTWELFSTMLTGVLLTAKGVLVGLAAYMIYIALEPDVRRRSPETMISWSRALRGRLTDPLVGRDLLIGAALGVLVQILGQLGHMAPAWIGKAPTLATPSVGFNATLPFDLATVMAQVIASVLFASALVLVYLLLYVLIRRRSITTAVFVLLLLAGTAVMEGMSVSFVFAALKVGVVVLTLARFGMLPLIVALTVAGALEQIPMTFDPQSLFGPSSYGLMALIVLTAVYGLRTSLAGQRLLPGTLPE